MSSYREVYDLGNIYTTKDGQLHIKATSGIMATWTFHEYLKRFANVHISWDHRQINFDVLPKVTNFTLIPQDLIRFYQNPCLYGYSFAFWSWSQVNYVLTNFMNHNKTTCGLITETPLTIRANLFLLGNFNMQTKIKLLLKFIYSEKATKF